jgi:hypothetical protein
LFIFVFEGGENARKLFFLPPKLESANEQQYLKAE